MIEVSSKYEDSTVSRILELVENASSNKAKADRFITRFALYYTPVVVIAAVMLALLPPLFIPGHPFGEWISRALIFLVISCPCALVISVPLAFFGGIGGASSCGVLVKGSNYLEVLANTDTIIFDKTGTLTTGKFQSIVAALGYTKIVLIDHKPNPGILPYKRLHYVPCSVRRTIIYNNQFQIFDSLLQNRGDRLSYVVFRIAGRHDHTDLRLFLLPFSGRLGGYPLLPGHWRMDVHRPV